MRASFLARRHPLRASLAISPLVATVVGFGGTIAIIIAAARAMGASEAETISWLTGLALATAIPSVVLSWRHRIPVIGAWSTPGAALIAAYSLPIGMEAAVGAFLLSAALILLTAAFRPLGRLIEAIPTSVASAMLAGVLIRFVIAVFEQAGLEPLLILPLVGLFLLVRLVSPAWAVLAVLLVGIAYAAGLGQVAPIGEGLAFSSLVFIAPRFDASVLIGLGLPLYLVTMASQNLPGFAVLRAAGYPAPTRSILTVTGLASLVTAFVGAHTSNLAAITAAICTGEDTHPDPAKRWISGLFYGLYWTLVAAVGASLITLFAALPAALIATVAGLALIGPLTGALSSAWAEAEGRFPAVLTLTVTASGLSLLGIGSAFWGLAAGLAALGLAEAAKRFRRS